MDKIPYITPAVFIRPLKRSGIITGSVGINLPPDPLTGGNSGIDLPVDPLH